MSLLPKCISASKLSCDAVSRKIAKAGSNEVLLGSRRKARRLYAAGRLDTWIDCASKKLGLRAGAMISAKARGAAAFEQAVYETYGPSGVAMLRRLQRDNVRLETTRGKVHEFLLRMENETDGGKGLRRLWNGKLDQKFYDLSRRFSKKANPFRSCDSSVQLETKALALTTLESHLHQLRAKTSAVPETLLDDLTEKALLASRLAVWMEKGLLEVSLSESGDGLQELRDLTEDLASALFEEMVNREQDAVKIFDGRFAEVSACTPSLSRMKTLLRNVMCRNGGILPASRRRRLEQTRNLEKALFGSSMDGPSMHNAEILETALAWRVTELHGAKAWKDLSWSVKRSFAEAALKSPEKGLAALEKIERKLIMKYVSPAEMRGAKAASQKRREAARLRIADLLREAQEMDLPSPGLLLVAAPPETAADAAPSPIRTGSVARQARILHDDFDVDRELARIEAMDEALRRRSTGALGAPAPEPSLIGGRQASPARHEGVRERAARRRAEARDQIAKLDVKIESVEADLRKAFIMRELADLDALIEKL